MTPTLCACGCGQETGFRRGRRNRFVFRHNFRGADHHAWRGGRRPEGRGYIYSPAPLGHPKDRTKNRRVFEHVLLAETALGRPLRKPEQVHHVDESKANNSPGNLVLCPDRKYHMLLHRRQRALEACGDANAIRCRLCGRYDNQDDIRVENLKSGEFAAHHRHCNNEHVKKYAKKRRQVAA
jgi:hypothetical protein